MEENMAEIIFRMRRIEMVIHGAMFAIPPEMVLRQPFAADSDALAAKDHIAVFHHISSIAAIAEKGNDVMKHQLLIELANFDEQGTFVVLREQHHDAEKPLYSCKDFCHQGTFFGDVMIRLFEEVISIAKSFVVLLMNIKSKSSRHIILKNLFLLMFLFIVVLGYGQQDRK